MKKKSRGVETESATHYKYIRDHLPLASEKLQTDRELQDRGFEIDMKLVYIAAGSISLLLTFIGILYQGERNITHLILTG